MMLLQAARALLATGDLRFCMPPVAGRAGAAGGWGPELWPEIKP